MNANTYRLVMLDECGDECIIGRYTLSLLTDPDEIEAWKSIKLVKARMSFPEAQTFYWEDDASMYWSVAEALDEEGRWYDEEDEDDLVEGARSNAPCDTYGLCPYGEQCNLYCNKEDTAENPPEYVEDEDEDDLVEGARSNAPCDTYGYCPYGEQCDLHCNRK